MKKKLPHKAPVSLLDVEEREKKENFSSTLLGSVMISL